MPGVAFRFVGLTDKVKELIFSEEIVFYIIGSNGIGFQGGANNRGGLLIVANSSCFFHVIFDLAEPYTTIIFLNRYRGQSLQGP